MQVRFGTWITQSGLAQTILAGVFLGVSFIIPDVWFLGLVSVWYIVHLIFTETSYRKVMVTCFYIWLIKSLLSIIWFWNAYPIGWVEGIGSNAQLALISAYWVTSAVWLASGGALFGAVCVWLLRKDVFPHYVFLLLLPPVWLVAELFSAFVFSICTAGPGAFFQTYFSFGMMGYVLGGTPLGVWLAFVGGVYGLTWLFVTMAVFGYWLIPRVSKSKCICLGGVTYLAFSYITFTPSFNSKTAVTIITIDTEFDARLLSTTEGLALKATTLATAIDEAIKKEPNVILLPEDSRYLSSQYNDLFPSQAMSMFLFTHADTKSLVIDSGRYTTETGMTVLRANVFDGVSKRLWQFDKQYLVPQGEFIPHAHGFVLRLLGYSAMVDAVAKNSAYRPGPLLQTSELPDYMPGILFCFESVSPQAVRTLVRARPNLPFIAHPISHAWFHTPTLLWQQQDVMLQLQARFSGVPIVSAGNMTTGKLYLPNGHVVEGVTLESGTRYTLREFRF